MKDEKKPTRKDKSKPDIRRFLDDFWSKQNQGNRFGFFDEFEEQFQKMEEQMHQMYSNMMNGNLPNKDNQNTRFYGYTYHVGPDGQPHFQEFGNTPELMQATQQQLPHGREPLIDIQEGDNEIYVTVELPGVEKKDINLQTSEKILQITVNNDNHPFHKEVTLPAEINENKTDATYNNGVLSITLKKLKSKKKGKKINIK